MCRRRYPGQSRRAAQHGRSFGHDFSNHESLRHTAVATVVQHGSMAVSGERPGPPVASLKAAVDKMAAWIREAKGEALGEALIQIRETGIDPLEAVFAEGVRHFDKSGEYKADGALSLTAWLRWKCKLSGGAAMERVEIARQLEKLPQTQAAFASGDVGYQHVAVLARAAEHVGATAVRKEEGTLLQAAQTMDPSQFTTVAKNFEHRVDAAGALAEANHAYERRYFHIGEPVDGLVRIDGILDAEGGATLRTALQPFMQPVQDDARSYGQRCAEALVELGRHGGSGGQGGGAGRLPQALICRPHHRMVHEENWRLVRQKDGRFSAIPPPRAILPNSRSA